MRQCQLFDFCGSVIELFSRVKERPVKVLLDSGTIGNFVSDAMATALKLKITSDVDFQDLTLADGSKGMDCTVCPVHHELWGL